MCIVWVYFQQKTGHRIRYYVFAPRGIFNIQSIFLKNQPPLHHSVIFDVYKVRFLLSVSTLNFWTSKIIINPLSVSTILSNYLHYSVIDLITCNILTKEWDYFSPLSNENTNLITTWIGMNASGFKIPDIPETNILTLFTWFNQISLFIHRFI